MIRTVVAVAFNSLAAMTTIGWLAGDPQRAQDSAQNDFTSLLLKQMSDAQRHHSKLYADYRTGTRLLERPKELLWVIDDEPAEGDKPLTALLRDLICTSDVMLGVEVTNAVSNPIDDGTFLFTDYDVAVRSRLVTRHMTKTPAEKKTAVITRIGGRVAVKSDQVRAEIQDFPLLEVGSAYLLFARFIEQTGAFSAMVRGGTFYISGSRALRRGPARTPAQQTLARGIPSEEFMQLVALAVSKGCVP